MKCRQFQSRTLMQFDLERSNGSQQKKNWGYTWANLQYWFI